MKALRIAGATVVSLGLQDEIRRSEESRYDHRLHGVLLVAQGMTCPEVAVLLGDAPRSVENWVRRFEVEGLAGQEGERPGRPRRLSSLLREGKFFFRRETDKFNGATFFGFLKALYRVSTAGPRRAVVITDNARYHHARLHRDWREQHAHRFELDYLPPYSPDLNPIERVWKLTRRQCLHNRYFPLLDEIVDSVEPNSTDG